MLNIIAIIWLLENLILSLISFGKIRMNLNQLQFIYRWGFINGAFVYEDFFIFGLFHAFSVLLGFLLGDLRYWFLIFILFWIVRSAGEILYFFLQQFIQPKHHPHYIRDNFKLYKFIFGNISEQKCFILTQVILQCVLTSALFALIQLLRTW